MADISGEDDEDEEIPTRRQRPPPRLDWKKLGQKACVAFQRTPSIDFMYVHFSVLQFNLTMLKESLNFVYFDDEFTGRGNVREYSVNVALFGYADVIKHEKNL